jgi:Bacterial sugar transferase
MYKFRTMVGDAEQRRSEVLHLNEMDGPVFKVADDPRLTRLGRFLRCFSLDELPQLLNVVKGEMSLVRPASAAALRGEPDQGRAAPPPRDAPGHDRDLADQRPEHGGIRRVDANGPRLRGWMVAGSGRSDPARDYPRCPTWNGRTLTATRSPRGAVLGVLPSRAPDQKRPDDAFLADQGREAFEEDRA